MGCVWRFAFFVVRDIIVDMKDICDIHVCRVFYQASHSDRALQNNVTLIADSNHHRRCVERNILSGMEKCFSQVFNLPPRCIQKG
jgi:hypothetical protein